ncbi:MAG: hypothetical protein ABR511_07550 [Acidimicrobiales bacterium]
MEAARVAGHARWLEGRLFEVVGGWVQAEPHPRAKAFWAVRSRRHADHAAGWHDRQPRVAHLDPDTLAVAASPEVAALFDALAALDGTAPRLQAVGGVLLPALVAAYRARIAVAHPLADGATVRWATRVAADEEEAAVVAVGLAPDPGGSTSPGPELRIPAGGPGAMLGLADAQKS